MNRLIKCISAGITVSYLVVSMIGCAANNRPINTGSPGDAETGIPKLIENMIEKKYSQSIHAVGEASSTDKVIAVKKARLDAEHQIANTFRNDMSGLQKNFLEEVNNQRLEEFRVTVESFTNITLQGVSEAKQMLSKGKEGYTAYVLMTVSAETIKNLIDEKTSALTNFKALQSYKELEDRVAKDNAARAQSDPQ